MDRSSKVQSALPMAEAIAMVNRTSELCFSNNFHQAKEELEPWVQHSMYHALAYSGIMCIQALLKFEQQAIQKAAKSIKHALNVCERHRKRPKWSETISSWIWNPSYENFTEDEKHAELCYTESLLLDSLVTFIQDENILSFVWGAFKIRRSYQNYKTCLEMVVSQHCSSRRAVEMTDLEAGIHFGIGGFNLVLSLLPPIIIKLLEWVGFSGDRVLGLRHLQKGSRCRSLRSPLCSLLLLGYHTWIIQYLGNGDGDVDSSEEILQPLLTAFPKGALFLFFDGRIKHSRGRLDEAISRYKHSLTVQSDIKQFHHFFYWELMWCYAYKGDWVQAYCYAGTLFRESLWSRTVYLHLKGSFKVMARLVNQIVTRQDEEEQDKEEYLFRQLPDFKQRIGGQSIPFEDFAIHKAKKYFQQNGHLFLPGLELIYIWNGFKVLNHRSDLVEPLIELVEISLHKLKQTKADNRNYVDDLCLGKLILGMCYRCLDQKTEAMECLKSGYSQSKDISHDLYLAPYTCAEIGFLYLEQGDFNQAKEYLERARKHRDHLLQSLLHLRIHAALQKSEDSDHKEVRTNKLFPVNQQLALNGDSSFSGSEEDFFDAEEDCSKLLRHDSSSSFDIITDDELDFFIQYEENA